MERLKQLIKIGWPVLVLGLFVGAGFLMRSSDGDLPVTPIFTSTSIPPVVTNPEQLFATAQALTSQIENNKADAETYFELGLLYSILDVENATFYLDQAAAFDFSFAASSNQLKSTLRLVEFSEDVAYRFILTGQGLAAIQEWRLAQAAFYLSAEANPDYAEAWAFLGEAQQKNGEDGLLALETAFALDPESFSVNIFYGTYWRRQNRPELAIPYLQKALELDPQNILVHEDLGNALGEAGNIEEALGHFQFIIDEYPFEASSWIALAKFSLDNEIRVETVGISAARQAVVLDQENPVGFTLLGRAYALKGDNYNAEKFYEQAIELNSSYAPAHFYLGLFYINDDDPDKAYPHLEKVLELTNDIGMRQDALSLIEKING